MLVVSDPTNSVLKTFQLKDQILVWTVTKPATRSDDYGVFGVSATLAPNPAPSTTDIQYFNDDLFNFVRVTSF
jgi:hypothetical protein